MVVNNEGYTLASFSDEYIIVMIGTRDKKKLVKYTKIGSFRLTTPLTLPSTAFDKADLMRIRGRGKM